MIKPGSLNSRLANWDILLSQYDMIFIPQKVIKGQIPTDFLAAHSILEISKLHEDIPDEVIEANMTSSDDVWQMFKLFKLTFDYNVVNITLHCLRRWSRKIILIARW